jgi:hypothetical protein
MMSLSSVKQIARVVFVLSLSAAAYPLSSAYAAADQSPGKIIDRYRKATGGKALKRVRSTYMTGRARSQGGPDGRFTFQAASPDRLRIDVEAGEFKSSECYNGKSAWRLDARGLRTLLGEESKRLRLGALLASSRLAELKRARILPTLAGQSTVEGRPAQAVDLSKDGVKVKHFFDSATYLLIKQERDTADGPEEVFFSNHRPVDGVMEPFEIRIKRGQQDLTVTIDRVVHNAEVEPASFRYPQIESSRPLPELEPLMDAITRNQDKLEEMREKYTCRVSETSGKLDGSGRVKETETKVYEVTPVAGSLVERLISVNGKELSPSEREKEDKRVQKQIEDLIKDKEKDDRKRQRARAKGEKEEEDDDPSISDFLRICEITSVRRETYRGHEVVAFDFEPKKGYKPKNRAENLITKLAGTIWVDEEARQIARLEAHLTDTFKIGGGVLASLGSSTAFAFEQEKIDGELWLPSYLEANISVRLLLFAKLNRSEVRRYTDYKKYSIDSDYNLKKPDTSKPTPEKN